MGRWFLSVSIRSGKQLLEGGLRSAHGEQMRFRLHRNPAPRRVANLLGLWVLFAAISWPGHGLAAPRDPILPPAPPQPMQQKVTVKRGATVDVPLRIYGTRAQTLTWLIRRAPGHGKLSNLRQTAPEAAIVTYTAPADLRAKSDTFTFSARSNEGASAPATVQISIVDEDPRIVVSGEVDFGSVLVGDSAERTLEFTNSGGGVARGEIQVDPPWQIVGADTYELERGARHITKVRFTPTKSGEYSSEARFTSQPDGAAFLRGIALAPLAIAPQSTSLAHSRGSRVRLAPVTLRNNTDEELTVTVADHPRLQVSEIRPLPAHSEHALTIRTLENDVAEVDETLSFASGKLSVSLLVKSPALPAVLTAIPERVTFPQVKVGLPTRERIILENSGGRSARVNLSIAAPFQCSPATLVLPPQSRHPIELMVVSNAAGSAESELRITGENTALSIPVSAIAIETSASTMRNPARGNAGFARVPPASDTTEDRPSASATTAMMPGPRSATLLEVGGDRAVFAWENQLPPGAVFRCLQRRLVADENGTLTSEFRLYPDCVFTADGGQMRAEVKDLASGRMHHFRIDGAASGGDALAPVSFIQIYAPAAKAAGEFPMLPIVIGVALGLGVFVAWLRLRAPK